MTNSYSPIVLKSTCQKNRNLIFKYFEQCDKTHFLIKSHLGKGVNRNKIKEILLVFGRDCLFRTYINAADNFVVVDRLRDLKHLVGLRVLGRTPVRHVELDTKVRVRAT